MTWVPCRYSTRTASCKDTYGKMPFFESFIQSRSETARLLVCAVVEKRTNGSAAELHEPMATKPARSRRNRWGIWLYKRSFFHRILRFFLLQQRRLRSRVPRFCHTERCLPSFFPNLTSVPLQAWAIWSRSGEVTMSWPMTACHW